MEIALRQYDPTVSLPYWDSTPDARLDDPTASVLWDDELMGSAGSDGTLNSGLFAYWQAHLNACPRDQYPPRDAVEFIHGSNHVWIGGDMRVTTQATNDPIFFLHHCMIDNIWETWRLSKQTRAQRQNDYPTDNIYCSSQSHFARSIMVPFSPIVNIDGLSNDYTGEHCVSNISQPRSATNHVILQTICTRTHLGRAAPGSTETADQGSGSKGFLQFPLKAPVTACGE
ncbi:unnamed protein product [Haemonchus placei]|uniref:Tyrosinase copper-binding domain-containing protein n=1 Tax=Haemonchus placei TaxID=6290 RepID=A0A3P8A103_HAEPC|nr:unnamed protein product [Haemonchus placei]